MAIRNLQDKFIYELSDIYDAESRFLKGQMEMLQQAHDPHLKGMLQQHIQETQQQIANLDMVFGSIGIKPLKETCEAAKGLVKEANEGMREAMADEVRDCVISGAATKVEHYEIASYRGLVNGALQLGEQQLVDVLRQNLLQEEQTARLLEQGEPQLLQAAMQASQTSTARM